MDPQDNSYRLLNFSRTFSIQSLNCSTELFFDKSRGYFKQTKSPPKKTKLDAILNSLRAFKTSQSTTDLHSTSRYQQSIFKTCDQPKNKDHQKIKLNKNTSSNFTQGRESIKNNQYMMNSPSKKYLQTFKKEENSYSHQIKQLRSQRQLKKIKQSQIIITKNHHLYGHTTSNKILFQSKSPPKNSSLELQKSSLEAIKEKLLKYGINTQKNHKDQNLSRINLNKSQKYPETKKSENSFQDLRLASSGQFSPNLIKGIKEKLKNQGIDNLKDNSHRPLTKLKEQTPITYDKIPYETRMQPHSFLISGKTSIIENDSRISPQKHSNSNSINSTTIHAKCFNFSMQNFAGIKFRAQESIGPRKSGSYGNQRSVSNEKDQNKATLKQKPGSWGHKKCFKHDFYRSSNLTLSEKHDLNLKQTIETNCTVQKLEKKLTFKDFILGRQIGKGKFGRVYICIHRQSGFLCAMKIIKKDLIRKQRNIEQLIRQIKIQTYLNHSNSVKMHAFFDDRQNIYLLMEYCVDGQLYALLKNKKKFEEDEAIPIIKDICEGLNHLHEQNIIHRDVKPENVVMSFQLSKLCDFGWSVNSNNQKRETFCGTPLYVSPELLMGKTYDYKVDIWALGIMVYELLTGKLPFEIKNEKELRKIVTSEVKYPEHLSENAINFIQHLLQKNPSYRNDMETILKHKFLIDGMNKNKPNQKSG